MKTTFVRNSRKLFYSCALIVALPISQAWSVDIEEEIVLPCRSPIVSTAHEAGEHLSGDFFNHEENVIDDRSRAESVLMWMNRGGDQRQQIANTKQFPFSTQVYFTVRFPRSQKNTSEIGTGTMIEKDVILTAAHVVYSHDKGGYYENLRCVAAPNGPSAPFGIPDINNVKVSDKYIKKGEGYMQYDYALVFLRNPLGEKTGCMGLSVLKDDAYKGLKVTIAGYPGDKIKDIASPSMWSMEGGLTASPEELYHEIDTYAGQSGSGMWYKKDKGGNPEYYLVGVHAYGTEEQKEGSYNRGPRLTKEKAKEIIGWIQAFQANTLKFENKARVAKKTVEAGTVGASSSKSESMSLADTFEDEDLLKDLRPTIQRQDGLEWYDLALKYTNGDEEENIEPDEGKAFECFAEAFDKFNLSENQNNPEVLHRLAVMYNLQRYVNRKDSFKAVNYWKQAADQGHVKAIINLGLQYEKGEGVEPEYTVEQRYQTAFKYFEQAALKGNDIAQYNLGEAYEQGKGVKIDKLKAVGWYNKSNSQGNDEARDALERMAEEGYTPAQEALDGANG